MSGTNTYKEHLLYNEKKRNVKNIDIAFDTRQLCNTCKNFQRHPRQNFDPRHPRYPRHNFMNPRHPRYPRTHATHATYAI